MPRAHESYLAPETDDETKKLLEGAAETIIHGEVAFPEPNLTNHRWRQRGIYVGCDSCQHHHGFTVEPDKLLTGIDDRGYPTFKSISA